MLAFDDVGAGPPVLLLHSAVADRRMWAAQLRSLADAHRCIAPDLPGFGESPLEPGPNEVPAALVELLDALQVERVAVVGASFGGRMALDLVDGFPERVDRLVLLAPGYRGVPDDGSTDAVDAEEGRLLAEGSLDAAAGFAARSWLGPDAGVAARMLVATMQRRAYAVQVPADAWDDPPSIAEHRPDLGAIGVPVTIVTGDLDFSMFDRIGDALEAAIPAATRIRLPWAGHLPSLERPEEISALLRSLLA